MIVSLCSQQSTDSHYPEVASHDMHIHRQWIYVVPIEPPCYDIAVSDHWQQAAKNVTLRSGKYRDPNWGIPIEGD